MITSENSLFVPTQDSEAIQAVVLAAAIRGHSQCRDQLSRLYPSFEEPYRTIGGVVAEMVRERRFINEITVPAALEGKRLYRRGADGVLVTLTPAEALALVLTEPTPPEQSGAYVALLEERLEKQRRDESNTRLEEAVRVYREDPTRLHEVEEALTEVRRKGADGHPRELLKIIPYFRDLLRIQTGTKFRGLDSGFGLLNQKTNGLDTGLWVIAARPSMGKTTFVWQLCQQAAMLNDVEVLFVSMEQSEEELRAKALARLSKLDCRAIARGGFRSDDPAALQPLVKGMEGYSRYGRQLTIIPGDPTTNVGAIGDIAAGLMAQSGARRCLIAVDYLQILPVEPSGRAAVTSSKDKVDLNVSALRRLARRFDSPVIAISSENRAGYSSKRLDVFKESGGIEYSCDIAAVMTEDKAGSSVAGDKHRMIDLSILKNRNGEAGCIKYKFYPQRAEFVEHGEGRLLESDNE